MDNWELTMYLTVKLLEHQQKIIIYYEDQDVCMTRPMGDGMSQGVEMG